MSESISPRTLFFALHGVDESGHAALGRPSVTRDQLMGAVANLPTCAIGMEDCCGAHRCARQFMKFGHTIKLMAPKLVAPHQMSGEPGENDAADSAAICESVQRPNMRFVPDKTELAQPHPVRVTDCETPPRYGSHRKTACSRWRHTGTTERW